MSESNKTVISWGILVIVICAMVFGIALGAEAERPVNRAVEDFPSAEDCKVTAGHINGSNPRSYLVITCPSEIKD